jgi:hypothetical protein
MGLCSHRVNKSLTLFGRANCPFWATNVPGIRSLLVLTAGNPPKAATVQAPSRYTAMQLATDHNHYLLELAKALRRFAGEGENESEKDEARSPQFISPTSNRDPPRHHIDIKV